MIDAGERGAAWVRLRRDIMVISSLLVLIGLLLIILGPDLVGGFFSGMGIQNGREVGAWVSIFLGLGLIALAVFFLLTRPWSFLREMETRMAGMEGLRAELSEHHLAFGPADVHFHHAGGDGQARRICPKCGGLMDQGECRLCMEEDQKH